MKPRSYIFIVLLSIAFAITAFSALPATAQDNNQDNQPHITPRNQATPTPSPTPQAKPTPKPSDDQYEQPPFPGDVTKPGETPKQPPLDPNQASPKRTDEYERPPFPGDAPGTSPTGRSLPSTGSGATGESSSRDSQIDVNAHPEKDEPKAAEDDPSVFKPWDPHKAAKDVEVGEYYLKLKNYRAALERFNHALVYKPDDAEATYELAFTQEKLELLAQADQNYHKYLKILPNGPKSKESEEAIKRLAPQVAGGSAAAAVAPDPGQAKIASHDIDVGETYLSGNQFEAARQRFEEALRITPDNPLLFFRMGQALQGTQKLDAARLYYRKYLEAQPKGKFAKNAKNAITQIEWTIGK